MQALAGAVGPDQVIVADPGEHAAPDVGRMHDDVHVSFNAHRLIVADERPFHQVVALAVAV